MEVVPGCPLLRWLLLVMLHSAHTGAPVPAQAQLQLCYNNLQACLEDTGFEELNSLHQWILDNPSAPYDLLQSEDAQSVPIQDAAFGLFRDLGFAVLASMLDLVRLCQVSDQGCTQPGAHFQQAVTPFQAVLEAQMTSLVRDYTLQNGVRSCVIRTGRNLRSDLMKFARDLPGLLDTVKAIERTAELVRLIGHRSRMLAHQLGMHAWVRSLPVPGRGTPMFILHDEYASQQEMVQTLVANMVRNGQTQLSVVEVGASPKLDWRSLLEKFPGLQYLGVHLPSSDQALSSEQDEHQREYQQARDHLKEYSQRTALHQTTSRRAAAGIPLHALDIVLVRATRDYSSVSEDLEMWEARVKPGGIMAGSGFSPQSQDGVRAICNRRFANEVHAGVDGTFWWYVEPEE